MRCRWLVAGLLAFLCTAGCARRAETRDVPVPSVTVPPSPPPPAVDAPEEMVVDPFCGVRLRRSEAAASAEYGGRTWWFCLEDHREAFLADPEGALRRLRASDPDAAF